jgi:hypothetical protein
MITAVLRCQSRCCDPAGTAGSETNMQPPDVRCGPPSFQKVDGRRQRYRNPADYAKLISLVARIQHPGVGVDGKYDVDGLRSQAVAFARRTVGAGVWRANYMTISLWASRTYGAAAPVGRRGRVRNFLLFSGSLSSLFR